MAVPVYYAVLGLDQHASDDDVHQAYRMLAARYHPERNPGDRLAARRFQAIVEAYAVLGDPVRRAAYDAQLSRGIRRAPRSAAAEPSMSGSLTPTPEAAPALAAATRGTRRVRASGWLIRYPARSMCVAVLLALLAIGAVAWLQRHGTMCMGAQRCAAVRPTRHAVPSATSPVMAVMSRPSSSPPTQPPAHAHHDLWGRSAIAVAATPTAPPATPHPARRPSATARHIVSAGTTPARPPHVRRHARVTRHPDRHTGGVSSTARDDGRHRHESIAGKMSDHPIVARAQPGPAVAHARRDIPRQLMAQVRGMGERRAAGALQRRWLRYSQPRLLPLAGARHPRGAWFRQPGRLRSALRAAPRRQPAPPRRPQPAWPPRRSFLHPAQARHHPYSFPGPHEIPQRHDFHGDWNNADSRRVA